MPGEGPTNGQTTLEDSLGLQFLHSPGPSLQARPHPHPRSQTVAEPLPTRP